jgi:site-specific DNA-methyltransferase (cytosine-N4-specific)
MYQQKLNFFDTHKPKRQPLPSAEITEEEWNFNGVDTQYSMHGLHTYLAAMIPQLARRLIEQYVPENGCVLDPFCGGGAVLVESILSGREAYGRDINDLAVIISKAKTKYINPKSILAMGHKVLKEAKDYEGEAIGFEKGDWISYWFKPYMMKPLTALRRAIDTIEDKDLKILFQTIFSTTVRSVSLTYRNEIRLRRMSEKEREKFNPDVFEKFEGKILYAVKRMDTLPKGTSADVARANVIKLNFSDQKFTTIICSPPYGDERNGVPYIQFARNMLMWLGYKREKIMETKKSTLGWRKENKKAPPSPSLHQYLENINTYPNSAREAIAFYADYYQALKEMARVVSDRVIIVIGQRVLQNTVFDNAKITTELMKDIGLSLEAMHQRKLPTKRLPKMREFGAAIDREYILIYKK